MRKATLLGSAAGLVLAATATAGAADLPFGKAAPVAYVRVCDAYGSGFFYIPGTDSCLRVSGQVRAEYTVRADISNNPAARSFNLAGQLYNRDESILRARVYLNADTRTQTAYGTFRSFLSLRMTNDSTNSGPFGGRGATVAGRQGGTSTGIFQGFAPQGTATIVDRGYIQFAGITAGIAQSFFDFDAQSYEVQSNSLANSNQIAPLFAYTATFGGGFSATISAEDSSERRIGDNGTLAYSGLVAGTTPVLPGFSGTINNPSLNAASPGLNRASVLAYSGQELPDIVANVRYDAAWGSAQLSGAYHQLRSLPVDIFNHGAASGAPTTSTGRTATPSADGFAVLGGVKVLLPQLAKGDSFTIQGTYEQGAMDYVNPLNYFNGASNVYDRGLNGSGGNSFSIPVNDAFVLSNGSIGMNKAAGGFGAIRHYFVPQVYGTLFGDYLHIANPVEAQRLGASYDSADVYQVGANVIWSPIKDSQIGGEVLYTNLNYRTSANGLTAAALGNTPKNPDDLRGRFTFRKSF